MDSSTATIPPVVSKYFMTDDHVRLHYKEAAAAAEGNHTLLLLPGWSQTCDEFANQIHFFSQDEQNYRAIALDPRGHGHSNKPNDLGCYNMERFARDVANLIEHLVIPGNNNNNDNDKNQLSIAAHSVSCFVMWTFWHEPEFAHLRKRIESIVFVDQMLVCFTQPHWSQREILQYGARDSAKNMEPILQAMKVNDETGCEVRRGYVSSMFDLDDKVSSDEMDVIMQHNDDMPPSLVVGGTKSHRPAECIHYTASQIPNAKAVILPRSHFMFYEEPEAFNTKVSKFLLSHRLQPQKQQSKTSLVAKNELHSVVKLR